MRTTPRSAATATLLAALLLTTVAAVPASAQDAESPADTATIPLPNLEGMDPAVEQQLTAGRRAAEEIRQSAGEGPELARALGELGGLYFLYGLMEPAISSLDRAAELQPEELRWTYLLAYAYQSEGRLEEAAEHYLRALELRTDHLPSLVRLGEVRLAQSRPADAAEVYRRGLEASATCAACRFGLGQAAMAQGRPQDAIEDFTAALELQPEASAVHYPLGQAYRRAGDTQAARRELEQVGEQEITLPDPVLSWVRGLATGAAVHFVRGQRALTAGNLGDALEEFRQAVDADPDNVPARRALALTLKRRGDLAGAVEEYRRAVEQEPANALNHLDLGLALVDARDLAGAAEHFLRAIELDPEFADAYLGLGVVLNRSDHPVAALQQLNRATALDPESADAHFELGMTLARLRQNRAAIQALRRTLELQPDHVSARLNLGTLLEREGETAEADKELERLLADGAPAGSSARAELALGRIAERAGDRQDALRHYRSAVDLTPRLPPARLRLGSMLAAGGDFAGAATEYGMVLATVPNHQAARIAHATALMLSGQEADAVASLRSGLQARPDDPYLQYELALLRAAAADPQVRRPQEARELARAAYGAQPNVLHGQAVALAAAAEGRFEDAVRAQERLLAELPPDDPHRAGARQRLESYRQERMVIAPWLQDVSLLYRPTVPLEETGDAAGDGEDEPATGGGA